MNIANRVFATKTSARWVIGTFLVLLLLLFSRTSGPGPISKRGGRRRQPDGHDPGRVRPSRPAR